MLRARMRSGLRPRPFEIDFQLILETENQLLRIRQLILETENQLSVDSQFQESTDGF